MRLRSSTKPPPPTRPPSPRGRPSPRDAPSPAEPLSPAEPPSPPGDPELTLDELDVTELALAAGLLGAPGPAGDSSEEEEGTRGGTRGRYYRFARTVVTREPPPAPGALRLPHIDQLDGVDDGGDKGTRDHRDGPPGPAPPGPPGAEDLPSDIVDFVLKSMGDGVKSPATHASGPGLNGAGGGSPWDLQSPARRPAGTRRGQDGHRGHVLDGHVARGGAAYGDASRGEAAFDVIDGHVPCGDATYGGAAHDDAAYDVVGGPVTRGDAAYGDATRGEAAHDVLDGLVARGDATYGDATRSRVIDGRVSRGDATYGDATRGEAAHDVLDGLVARGDATRSRVIDGRVTRGDATYGDATRGEAAHDVLDGLVARGDATYGDATRSRVIDGRVSHGDAAYADATRDHIIDGHVTRGGATHGDATHDPVTHGDASYGDATRGRIGTGRVAPGDAARNGDARPDVPSGDATHGHPAHRNAVHRDDVALRDGAFLGGTRHAAPACGATRRGGTCCDGTRSRARAVDGRDAPGDATNGDASPGDATYGDATRGRVADGTPWAARTGWVPLQVPAGGPSTLGLAPKRPGEPLGAGAKRTRLEVTTGDEDGTEGTPGVTPGHLRVPSPPLRDVLDIKEELEELSDTDSVGSGRVPSPGPAPEGDSSPDSPPEPLWPHSPGVCSADEGGARPEDKENRRPARARPHLRFEISSEDGLSVSADTLDGAWRAVADKVQEARANARLRHLSFAGMSGLRLLGMHHDAVVFLVEQLPGAGACGRYRFRYHPRGEPQRPAPRNPSGCARAELYARKCTFDMFSFLASQHRTLPAGRAPPREEDEAQVTGPRRATSLELPMAMRFRHLKRTAKEAVGVYRSAIHGRGLFCKRNIDAGEMVIEYSGIVIRSVLTDKREKYYDSKGIGCYMFRIDDLEVVDATMHGSAARFINHSCEPNCYSRVIQVEGHKRIVIFALRRIRRGEELTYDYKFPIEEPAAKLPCNCGAKRCRRFLN